MMTDVNDDFLLKRLAELEAKLASLMAENALLKAENLQLRQRLAAVEEYNRRLVQFRFGASSEKMIPDPGQQRLDLDGIEKGSPLEPVTFVPDKARGVDLKQPRRARRRRLAEIYPNLVLESTTITIPEHERLDRDGTLLVPVGEEVSDKLHWVPSPPVIHRTIRIRYGHPETGEKLLVAPVPDCITPKGLLTDDTIHAAVMSHVLDCLPWHRQELISHRSGCRISRSVWARSFADWCELFDPVARSIRSEILAQPVIGADSTTIRHQDGRQPRKCSATAIYGVTDGLQAFFHWSPDQRHHRALDVLAGYTGHIIRDEWAGWQLLLNQPDVDPPTMVGCNAHARRRFARIQEMDRRARDMVERYRQLYLVERLAMEKATSSIELPEIRLRYRQSKSLPIWKDIVASAQKYARDIGDAYGLGDAATYILKYQRSLARFLDDGRLPLDNNRTENVLRIVALLRKNRLFLGRSPDAGTRLATALTVMRSCVMLEINPIDYTEAVTASLLEVRRTGGPFTGPTPLQWNQIRKRSLAKSA